MVPRGLAPGNDPLPQSVAIDVPDCEGAVQAAAAPALRSLFAALPEPRGLEVVKRSAVRTVLRGTVGGLDVHVKVFRPATWSDRARDSLRGDRGSREARNLLLASNLNLPVVVPLACGVHSAPDGRRGFLVTRSVPAARTFGFDLPPVAIAGVGRLLRKAHDRGLLPGDLHPGNVVVDAAANPWLLDLASVRRSGDPDLARRARGLAFFCQELDGGPLDPVANPLLMAYLASGAELPGELRPLLVRAAREVRHRALSAFGRRSTRDCRHTVVLPHRRGQWRWALHQVEDEVDREELHAACREFVEAPPAPDKQGRRGAVWLGELIAAKQREQGAARRLFTAMYQLLFARVPQAEPVALATFDGTGHVFARRLPMPPLADELRDGTLTPAAVVAAAVSIGDGTGRLHAHGLRNRDLKFENLVRDPVSEAVCVVDLDGVRRKRPSDTRGQGRDLGRLIAAWRGAGMPGGRTAAFAFVRAYLRARRRLLQPAPARRVFRHALERADEWASAHRRPAQ